VARGSRPREISDAVREAVEQTLQRTLGSAERTRDRAQGAVDELVGIVDEFVRSAEQRISRGRRTVSGLIGAELPATRDDVRKLASALDRIERRLAAIERALKEAGMEVGAKASATARRERRQRTPGT